MAVDKKALNIELLKFAGFACTGGIWTYPDGVDVDNGVPFFPESVDECIKWIFPISPKYNPDVRLIQSVYFDWGRCSIIDIEGDEYEGLAKTPATAFCLAVKELKNAKE